jgi:hypothetical protein
MSPAAFLALLAIAMLIAAAARLEINFRRSSDSSKPQPKPGPARPELRMAPAGGYCQPPLSVRALTKR